jgi:hypothetical protein
MLPEVHKKLPMLKNNNFDDPCNMRSPFERYGIAMVKTQSWSRDIPWQDPKLFADYMNN